jgi:hypothetical protein
MLLRFAEQDGQRRVYKWMAPIATAIVVCIFGAYLKYKLDQLQKLQDAIRPHAEVTQPWSVFSSANAAPSEPRPPTVDAASPRY